MSAADCLAIDVPPAGAGTRPLRICHVMSADLWAGAEVQVATAASYLIEQPGVELSAVLFNDGWLGAELRRLGVSVTILDERRWTAQRILLSLVRFLRSHAIDIVHTHRHKDSVLGGIGARLAGVPHVVRTVHGLGEPMRGWDRAKYAIYDAIDKGTLWLCADRIVAVSERMAETLRQTGYPARAVLRVHNGINLRQVKRARARDDVRASLGIGDGHLLVGTAGRLAPVKGHAYLLRAAALVLKTMPEARFLFVGSGPLDGDLRTAARDLGVARQCIFIDPARDTRAGIYDLIAAMDLFVLPSLAEGIPMALLEAMALGRPVIASAVGGIPEVVTDRVSGLLVSPQSEQEIADACVALGRQRAWAQTLGARARRVAEERFSRERNGETLLRLYRTLVDRRAARRPVTAFALVAAVGRRAADACRRRLDAFRERQRMEEVRRHPDALMDAVRAARRLLVVCHGNIIRSAFAARLIAGAVADRAGVAIVSAGLDAMPGRAAHPIAVAVAHARGVDLAAHAAARVSAESVAQADVVFVMDIPQLVEMARRFPAARRKIFLFTAAAPEAPMEIGDPFDGDEAVFERCFEQITSAAYPFIRTLSDRIS